MQVVALAPGFYNGQRKRTGDVFDMDEAKFKKKDGKPVPPSWVKPVANANANEGRAIAKAAQKAETEKQKAGAIAASGGAAAKAKVDAAQDLAG